MTGGLPAWRRWRRGLTLALALAAPALAAPSALAQQQPTAQAPEASASPDAVLYAPSVWDLRLGEHALDLPTRPFTGFACGTNGGPPSRPVAGWSAFADCPAEAGTGLHEITFVYDDEPEYFARAHRQAAQTAIYAGTTIYAVPIIPSALFDDDGFMVGLRIVTDPRVDLATRDQAAGLSNFLMARFGSDGWDCTDLARGPREGEYRGLFIKRRCQRDDPDAAPARQRLIETHYFRKAGQSAVDPAENVATSGQFESLTRYEETLAAPIADRAARLAAIAARPAPAPDALAARALDCPGCDLSGADLKRARLAGAKLAGANLAGANLHGADLSGADLTGAILDRANLNRALLPRARLAGASLQRTMLYDARLDGADFKGADLRNVMAGASRATRADFTDARLSRADFTAARLNNAVLAGADFTDSVLDDADFGRADLTGAWFTGARLWRANLAEAKAAGAGFTSADLLGANLRGTDLAGADLRSARLVGTNVASARLDRTRFEGAALPAGFRPPPEPAAPAADPAAPKGQ